MRWGTLHPGIDIGVPTGTPIHAAAAGKVVWCGWESGYGNLVVIDHGGGSRPRTATRRASPSRAARTSQQGEVIGYSGCTGFCTGPHVHFEVRVNGTPVDPLGYLPWRDSATRFAKPGCSRNAYATPNVCNSRNTFRLMIRPRPRSPPRWSRAR